MSVQLPTRDVAHFSARWMVQFERVRPEEDKLGRAADAQQGESVRRIEALFSAARTAIGALRGAEADSALAEAEALIRAHSELPQAAWLLAEHHVISAERLQEENPTRARELMMLAAVLECARGEAFHDAFQPTPASELPAKTKLSVRGVQARDVLEWDAESVGHSLETRAGEHHVRVLRAGRLVWSGWVSVGQAGNNVDLELAAPTPCSADDLAGAIDGAQGPRASAETSCAEWAVAKLVRGELRMARCRRAECGAWQTAVFAPLAERPAPGVIKVSKGVPRWLTYAAVGAGTALVAGVILAQAGAFGGSDQTRERWVYTGFR